MRCACLYVYVCAYRCQKSPLGVFFQSSAMYFLKKIIYFMNVLPRCMYMRHVHACWIPLEVELK